MYLNHPPELLKTQGPMHQWTATGLGEEVGLQNAVMAGERELLPPATLASVSARDLSMSGQ